MKKILLVDDEPNFLAAMQCHLRPYRIEWTLTTASHGNEAMALIRKQHFDVIVTDILMPEKDGLETIIELRKAYPWVKIIAMSGGGRQVGIDILQCASRLGAHRTLEKPFDPQILLNILRSLLTAKPSPDQSYIDRPV